MQQEVRRVRFGIGDMTPANNLPLQEVVDSLEAGEKAFINVEGIKIHFNVIRKPEPAGFRVFVRFVDDMDYEDEVYYSDVDSINDYLRFEYHRYKADQYADLISIFLADWYSKETKSVHVKVHHYSVGIKYDSDLLDHRLCSSRYKF